MFEGTQQPLRYDMFTIHAQAKAGNRNADLRRGDVAVEQLGMAQDLQNTPRRR